MTDEIQSEGHYLCPSCQQHIPHARIDVIDVAAAVEADKLSEADVFRRTYLGHGTQSSVFVFQGHPGPFRTHVHTTHDEIGYVLAGTGEVRVGGVTRPVKKGDVWVIPANTPHGGRFEDAEKSLCANWLRIKGDSRLEVEEALQAIRAAWDHASMAPVEIEEDEEFVPADFIAAQGAARQPAYAAA